MANERINRIIVNISGDRIKSSLKGATIAINRNRPVNDLDIKKVIEKGINKINVEDNELIHCLPTNYRLDLGEEIKDPRNIYGENLSVNILLGMVPDIQFKIYQPSLKTLIWKLPKKLFLLMLPVYPAWLMTKKKSAQPLLTLAAAQPTLPHLNMVSLSLSHPSALAATTSPTILPGGLTTSFTHAERLKTLHGCAFMTSQDKEDLINVYPVGEEDDSLIKQVPKAELISIITPRIEEIFELVNKKLTEHGLRDITSHRVVLTGGGAQLSGIRDIANMVLDKQVRIGRPKNIINLPDNLYNPCFSTAIGLLLFALNYSEKKPNKSSANRYLPLRDSDGLWTGLNKVFK